jgi:anti-anti-sigma factor
MLKIGIQQINDILIVEVVGDLEIKAETSLRNEVSKFRSQEEWNKIVLNLEEVHEVDSAGIGEILTLIKDLAGRKKSFRVVWKDNTHLARLLHYTRVEILLNRSPGQLQAIEEFSEAA